MFTRFREKPKPIKQTGIKMKISKTTINYANKRGLDVDVSRDHNGNELLCIWLLKWDCEWLCDYIISEQTGEAAFNNNLCLTDEIKEELPAHIVDEKQLRAVIDFISSEIKDHPQF